MIANEITAEEIKHLLANPIRSEPSVDRSTLGKQDFHCSGHDFVPRVGPTGPTFDNQRFPNFKMVNKSGSPFFDLVFQVIPGKQISNNFDVQGGWMRLGDVRSLAREVHAFSQEFLGRPNFEALLTGIWPFEVHALWPGPWETEFLGRPATPDIKAIHALHALVSLCFVGLCLLTLGGAVWGLHHDHEHALPTNHVSTL